MFDITAQGLGQNLPIFMELDGATFKTSMRVNFRGEKLTTIVGKLNILTPTVLNVLTAGIPILPLNYPEVGGVGVISQIWRHYARIVVNRDPPLVDCHLDAQPGESAGGHPGNMDREQGCLCGRLEFPSNDADDPLTEDFMRADDFNPSFKLHLETMARRLACRAQPALLHPLKISLFLRRQYDGDWVWVQSRTAISYASSYQEPPLTQFRSEVLPELAPFMLTKPELSPSVWEIVIKNLCTV